ncbi:MAG: hypothetical protein C3F13_08765 [Anaerolineales bacterium]|nr:MAG: hypothetical protein C3F13_08765 [Anaerolineales bacterium]
MSKNPVSSTDRTEQRLLILAGAFMAVFSLALSLSNAARLRTWQVDYRWVHWLGFAVWLIVAWLLHQQLARHLPDRDPFLFPITALLSGWGLLTIWRLSDGLGLRQSAWLLLIGIAFMLAIRFDRTGENGRILEYLRRFKYVWLTSGLLLTAATLFLGTNPMGGGPRLWLGCCGLYFQPSEPLKLLLIIYLAAYLADRQVTQASSTRLLPLLTPTLLMTGLALLLLVFQRDLGTAALFMVLYAVVVYTGTGKKRVLLASLVILLLAAAAGYALFDVVSLRVDAWINPWLDPAGRSYQIVQSLLAVANGGLFGRGVGMGSPALVPIAQSDFIFSAVSEEIGLVGALGVLVLLALLVSRGMRLGMKSGDLFHRLLAIGLVVHLVGQSILIIAGNLRVLPLTGVTLPFVSYGGSSLFVSYFELLCLLLISNRQEELIEFQPTVLKAQTNLNLLISAGLLAGLAVTALAAGWWSLVRGPDVLTRTDNARRTIADRYVKRGSILDNHGQILAESLGQPGDYTRQYNYPALSPLLGYTDPVYGQAGVEASQDNYLRGLQGYPALTTWWEHLLYGQPPPGLDISLSLDMDLQAKADDLLKGHKGALVLLNARTGEILSMASSPSFDANQLSSSWNELLNDHNAPLYDRAAMGLYPTGNSLAPFLLAATGMDPSSNYPGTVGTECALVPVGNAWGDLVAAGCDSSLKKLVASMSNQEMLDLLDKLGLFTAPAFQVETLSSSMPANITDTITYLSGQSSIKNPEPALLASPLQMALAAATLSNHGERPAPRLVMAVDTPLSGWITLPLTSQAVQALSEISVNRTVGGAVSEDLPIWQLVTSIKNTPSASTSTDQGSLGSSWYLGGTSLEWSGAPLALAVVIEENNPQLARQIGHSLLQTAISP